MGGNRCGPGRTYVNLITVMILGGLWHGASWNFVFWGGFHGLLLALERLRGKQSLFAPLPRPFQVAGTFGLVLVSWVLFRTADLSRARSFMADMIGVGATDPGAVLLDGVILKPFYLLTVATAALVVWGAPQTWDWTRNLSGWKAAVCVGLFCFALLALTTQAYNPFIYFIF